MTLLTAVLATRAADRPDQDQMIFEAVGVPYGEVIEHYFGPETFRAGAIELDPGAVVTLEHRDAIGKLLGGEDTPDGYKITGRLSNTAAGRDAWQLVKDGVMRCSIGFEPVSHELSTDGETLIWTKVIAREFALTGVPAYKGATIDSSSLRTNHERGKMDTNSDVERDLTPRIDTLEARIGDVARDVALLSAPQAAGERAGGTKWPTIGLFLKALAAGDESAVAAHRNYTGATTSDTVDRPGFLGAFLADTDKARPVIEHFTRGALPSEGMSVDYAELKTDGVKVQEQMNEGEDLATGKVELKPGNAKIHTWGGWVQLSRQLVERTSAVMLTTTLTALAARYAKVTEAAVQAEVLKVADGHVTAGGARVITAGKALSAMSPDDWVNAIADAAMELRDRGFAADGLHVSRDVFKLLVNLKDSERRLMHVHGDHLSQLGDVNLTAGAAFIGGIPVFVLRGKANTAKAFFADRRAIQYLESPGAPAQLQQETVRNLAVDYSLYGYGAILTPFPSAVLPIKFAG